MKNHFHAIFPNDNYLDLRPYQYGWEVCAPLHSFGPFIRNHYLFHYIISGYGTLYSHAVNNEIHEYQLGANQGFLICPGQINLYTADENQPWKYVWLEFDGTRAKEFLLKAGLDQNHPIYCPQTLEQGTQLQEHMLYFTSHATKSSLHLVGQLSLFLDELIEFSANRQEVEATKEHDYYIHEAMIYIQQNDQRELSVDEVANFCKLNRNYFSRRFKELVGCTPQEFLIQQRLTNAAELLKITDQPIKNIADQCGYPNQLHFSQAFKKYYGLSPREWRKKIADHDSQLLLFISFFRYKIKLH